MRTQQIEPVHGFVSNPEAGRGIVIGALIVALIGVLIPALPALIGGADYIKRIITMGTKPDSPILLGYSLVVIGEMLLVLWHAIATIGLKRALLAFITLMAVGFVAEGLGVNYGWVFGPYHYSNDVYGHIWGVPLLVPVSWILNMYPAFYLALFLLPSELMAKPKTFARKSTAILLISCVGAVFCTLWDLMADPVFVPLGTWVWHIPGNYARYIEGGIPFINFVGWIGSGIVANIILQIVLHSTPPEVHVRSRHLDIYAPMALYFAPFAFGMMMELIYMRSSDVILVGLLGMGNVLLLAMTKVYLTKNGYREHQLAMDMSAESLDKLTRIQ